MVLLEILFQMLSGHKIKLIQSLDKKKYRQKYNLFVVEGWKIISELPDSSYRVKEVFYTVPNADICLDCPQHQISPADLRRISFLQHPKDAVALVEPGQAPKEWQSGSALALDGIQDPGNFGTILRLADWFGITQIFCSQDTVDLYNPKVVQASMGSFARVSVQNIDLQELTQLKMPLLAADLHGENLYAMDFPERLVLVLGNEGNGIRPETKQIISQSVTIPQFSEHQQTESLNVATATAIILGQIFSKK